jgi:hypothetical protein
VQLLDGLDEQAQVVQTNLVGIETVARLCDRPEAKGLTVEGERTATVGPHRIFAHAGFVDLIAEIAAPVPGRAASGRNPCYARCRSP